ncbi:MAG: hypothetical protein KDD60_00550 [Bdellovibrionales bacterium]|nr:hypothetical protein [Bdellovibrionales bacterium]
MRESSSEASQLALGDDYSELNSFERRGDETRSDGGAVTSDLSVMESTLGGVSVHGASVRGVLDDAQRFFSLWVFTFALCNILLFHLFTSLFISPETVGSAAFESRRYVYCIVLAILSIGGVVGLIRDFIKEFRSNVFTPLVLQAVVVLYVVLSFVAFLHLLLSEGATSSARLAIEHVVGVGFIGSWWLFLRSRAFQALLRRAGVGRKVPSSSHFIGGNRNGEAEEIRLGASDTAFVDAQVQKGIALVLERSIGGESVPVLRQSGDTLLVGSTILRGNLVVSPLRIAGREKSIHWFFRRFEEELSESLGLVSERVARFASGILIFSALLLLSIIALPKWCWSIAALFTLIPLVDLAFYLEFSRLLTFSRLFYRGAFLSGKRLLKNLSQLKRVAFHLEGDRDLPGVGKVASFRLIDERVDRDRLLGVVFALLRHATSPFEVAVREYCYRQAKNIDLFPVDNAGVTGQGLFVGTIQGMTFLVGPESALVDYGVHLELSETTITDSAPKSGGHALHRIFVSFHNEVVASFSIVPPFIAEMPSVVTQMKKLGVKTRLLSSTLVQGEVDELGRGWGFELADIRSFHVPNRGIGGSSEGGAPRRGASLRSDESDVLSVLFRPRSTAVSGEEEALCGEILTWFRPALWNLTGAGVILTSPKIALVGEVLHRAKRLQLFNALLVSVYLGIVSALCVGIVMFQLSIFAALCVACIGSLSLYLALTLEYPFDRGAIEEVF